MADARSEILRRVRSALADRPDPGPVPREYDRRREAGDVLGLLAERVADYQATVHRVGGSEAASAPDLPTAIGARLREHGTRTMTAPGDIPAEWRVDDVDWVLDDPDGIPLSTERVDATDGVLTGCAVAIAETGTLVLDAGPTQGRRMLSLIPDYHLCVVRAAEVVTSVPAALERLDPVRPLTFISGPSATSDIELDRVEGVHGPRTLDVLLVD